MEIKAISRHPNDPEYVNGARYFVPNWKDMTITMDGQVIDNKTIIKANAVKGTVDKVKLDSNGDVVLRGRYDPETVTVQGNTVTIKGDIRGCSNCTKGAMKRRRWWL